MPGVASFLLVVPLSALLIRRTPEDVGLLPDGEARLHEPGPSARPTRGDLATDHDWTLREAVRTPALWLIVTSFSIGTAGLGGLLLHAIPYMTDKGYSTAVATAMLTLFSIVLMVAKPV